MKRALLCLLGIGFGLSAPAALSGETAYTAKTVNVRAGPSRDYPLVARIPAGVPVEVNGCVADWTWCDVSLGFDRGWVYAGNLEYPYRDRRLLILGNGPMFGFPIITFSIGPYWDTYYSGRPWYSRRSYWARRPPPSHRVGPPRSGPPGGRPPAVRPPRGDVIRPPVNRPAPQPQPPRQHGRPEVARPQPARPAPARPPDNRPRSPRREERKPGGN